MADKKIKKVTTVTEEYYEDSPKTNEKTHIICILDRSGSMSSIMDDSLGGFNNFLKTQKELPDEATITVALFDDRYELIYDNMDIKEARELTRCDWYPRGTTALYDAIGKTINSEKGKLNKLDNKNKTKVLVCVVTDGHENASNEYKLDEIKSLINEREKDDWNFIYLAANQDAFDVGTSFGISGSNTFTYTADSLGVSDMNDKLYNATVTYRSMSTTDGDFGEKSKSLLKEDDDK